MAKWLVALAGALLAVLAGLPASAAAEDARGWSPCVAASSPTEPLSAIAVAPSRWRCDPAAASQIPERIVVRMVVDPAMPAPHYFGTRPSLFETMTLALEKDGKLIAETRYPASALHAGRRGDRLFVPLPAAASSAQAVLVAFDRPTSPGLVADAALHVSEPAQSPQEIGGLLLAAMVCGMLLMPLAFNAVYYRVLREKFVIWHLVISLSLLAQCLLTSGIVGNFFPLTIPIHARAVMISFGVSVAAAAVFSASFIEPRRLNPLLRKGLYVAAVQVLVLSLLHAWFPFVLRTVNTKLYYASFIPVLVLFCVAMTDAWRRGSRAVRYQLIGWAPFILMGAIRIATMIVPPLRQSEAMGLFYIAIVTESIATSLGVADRFMAIKRQRDRAVSRARSFESLSERDVLTGLYNRRALDGSLSDFERHGFTGFALIDLDNFKRVNDTHGHSTGDEVLCVSARVLESDQDATAVRLGGEEFLLLLRGPNAAVRAERLREAIPVRIAREVAALETLVTASAGMVEAPTGICNDFAELYRMADDLLYEAKHGGRNLLAAVTLPLASEAAAGAAPAVAA